MACEGSRVDSGRPKEKQLQQRGVEMEKPDHPVWCILRLIVIGVIFIAGASLAYKNPASNADVLPLLSLLLGVGGFDQLKKQLTKTTNDENRGG
jgi:hypothetical protein